MRSRATENVRRCVADHAARINDIEISFVKPEELYDRLSLSHYPIRRPYIYDEVDSKIRVSETLSDFGLILGYATHIVLGIPPLGRMDEDRYAQYAVHGYPKGTVEDLVDDLLSHLAVSLAGHLGDDHLTNIMARDLGPCRRDATLNAIAATAVAESLVAVRRQVRYYVATRLSN